MPGQCSCWHDGCEENGGEGHGAVHEVAGGGGGHAGEAGDQLQSQEDLEQMDIDETSDRDRGAELGKRWSHIRSMAHFCRDICWVQVVTFFVLFTMINIVICQILIKIEQHTVDHKSNALFLRRWDFPGAGTLFRTSILST